MLFSLKKLVLVLGMYSRVVLKSMCRVIVPLPSVVQCGVTGKALLHFKGWNLEHEVE